MSVGVSAGAAIGAAAGEQALRTSVAAIAIARRNTGVVLDRMEVIGLTSGRPPSVDRPEGPTAVFLTFDGLSDAKVLDRDTRIKITLQGPQAARLWHLLGELLTDEEKAAD